MQLPDRYRVKTKSSGGSRPRSTPLNPPRRQPSWVTSHHHGRRAPLLRLFTNHDMEEAWGRGVAGRRRRGDRARGQGGTRGEATLLVKGDLLEELQAGRSFWSGATSSSSAGRDRGRSRRSRWRSSCSRPTAVSATPGKVMMATFDRSSSPLKYQTTCPVKMLEKTQC
jgi:hypothetical protein